MDPSSPLHQPCQEAASKPQNPHLMQLILRKPTFSTTKRDSEGPPFLGTCLQNTKRISFHRNMGSLPGREGENSGCPLQVRGWGGKREIAVRTEETKPNHPNPPALESLREHQQGGREGRCVHLTEETPLLPSLINTSGNLSKLWGCHLPGRLEAPPTSHTGHRREGC